MHGWTEGEFLAFDMETTGTNPLREVPVSVALLHATASTIGEVETFLVDPGREIPAEATAIHGITSERAAAEGRPLADALSHTADVIVDAGNRGVPVTGMNLSYDLTMLDAQLWKLHGAGLIARGWHGPVLDALVLDRHVDRYRKGKRTLDDLCTHYGVALDGGHRAEVDAHAALRVVLAIADRHPEIATMGIAELTAAQVQWHRTWAESFDAFLRGKGKAGLRPQDFDWPVKDTTFGG